MNTIFVRTIVNGKLDNVPFSRVPFEKAIEFICEWNERKQVPARILQQLAGL
jgi:hypothetical protein